MIKEIVMSVKNGFLLIALSLLIFASSCSSPSSEQNTSSRTLSASSTVSSVSVSSFNRHDYDWVSTDDSTCFSEIGYDYSKERLAVTFRDSGKTYVYHDVPESVWDDLYAADSRGGFYNSYIKGQYVSERIDND
jgi:hypothetical protein